VVARRQKLIAASLVLAAGIALALPLRRNAPLPSGRMQSGEVAPKVTSAPPADHLAGGNLAASVAAAAARDGDLEISLAEANDPFAGASPPELQRGDAKVFTTVSDVGGPAAPLAPEPPEQELHIIHEGDSLARLAGRYLGDESRSLEIFELNRDVLGNPHVLPLGVELRIPRGSSTGD
jgi:nucleoid-associated protein YgaU